MLSQLSIGSALIATTIVVQVVFSQMAINGLKVYAPKLLMRFGFMAPSILLTGTTLWLLTALSIAMWIWASMLVLLGVFGTIEHALYFSMVAFTTLGFGDVILPQEWRLLSGFIAANGLVLFGLNTAFLIETLRSILEAPQKR